MKTFKTKTYDYKDSTSHVKLRLEWRRGGGCEATIIILKGKQKHMSGFFGIGKTKVEAISRLYDHCRKYYHGSAREITRLIPWQDLLDRFRNQ